MDPDGKHICNLLLIFIMTYMPELIIAGRVYKSVPPLFGMNIGTKKNPKYRYFTDRLEYSQYVQTLFSQNHQLSTTTGVMLSDVDALQLICKNIMYVYEMELICKRYALNPRLLELALSLINEPFEVMKDKIEKEFRFIKVEKSGNVIKATGLINSIYQMLILNDKLIEDSKRILDLIYNENANRLYYMMDGEVTSLYFIMKAFEKSQPSSIKRFKGLGEMNDSQLAESVFDPEGQRVLIQYTFEDAKKEIEQIKYIQSNKDQLLSKINVSRYELLG